MQINKFLCIIHKIINATYEERKKKLMEI